MAEHDFVACCPSLKNFTFKVSMESDMNTYGKQLYFFSPVWICINDNYGIEKQIPFFFHFPIKTHIYV